MTLEDAISQYVRRKRATGISFTRGYSLYRAFLRAVGNLNLRQVNVNHVSLFLNQSQASAAVFRAKHNLFLHFFEYWGAHGEISCPPMPANRPPQRSNYIAYIYTREELGRLIRMAPACRTSNDKIHPKTLRAILLMLYATGATCGEVANLRTESVDLKNGTIRFPGNRRKASRCIPIGSDLNRVLRQYNCWREHGGAQSDRFFSRNDGRVIDSRSVHRNFRRLRQRAGIAGYQKSSQKPCIRDLRSTFAVHQITTWIKKKENLDVMLPALAAYMGNVGLESTERYLRLAPARFQDALDKLSPPTTRAKWRDDSKLLEFLTKL